MRLRLVSIAMLLGLLGASSVARTAPAKKPTAVKPVKKPAVHQKALPAGQVFYVCKMDQYTSTKPGKCPRCGMKLTKMVAQPVKPAGGKRPKM